MNLWINVERPELLKLLKKIHGLVLNDGEARLLTEKKNLIEAGREVMKLGPKFVIIKKGEHGSLLCIGDEVFVLPAYPADKVIDPTGAGDSFAGGMMGYLSTQGTFSPPTIKPPLLLAQSSPASRSPIFPSAACRPPTVTKSTIASRRSRPR